MLGKLDELRRALDRSVGELKEISNTVRDLNSDELLQRFTDSYKVLNGKVIAGHELDQIMKFDYDGPKSIRTEVDVEMPFASIILTKNSEII